MGDWEAGATREAGAVPATVCLTSRQFATDLDIAIGKASGRMRASQDTGPGFESFE